jgi:hypothetical protein
MVRLTPARAPKRKAPTVAILQQKIRLKNSYKFAFQPPQIQSVGMSHVQKGFDLADNDELNNALLEQDALLSKHKKEIETMEIMHTKEMDVLKERHVSQLYKMSLKVDCALQSSIKGKSPLPMSLPPAAQTAKTSGGDLIG